jgi:hypothetical protein
MRYRVPFDCVFIAAAIAGWSWIIARTGISGRLPAWAPTLALAVVAITLVIGVGIPIAFAN